MNAPFEILEEVTGINMICGSSAPNQLSRFLQILVKSYEARYPNAKLK
jgi:hypothetical protein